MIVMSMYCGDVNGLVMWCVCGEWERGEI